MDEIVAQLESILSINESEIKLLDQIGEGGYGKVWKGYWSGNKGGPVAVKKLIVHNNNKEQIVREIISMNNLRHETVIRLNGICTICEKDEIWVVMEYADGGSLFDLLHAPEGKFLPWDARWDMALGVTRAVRMLHSRAVVHRDIKSPNFLVCKGKFKLADFGMASGVSVATSVASRMATGAEPAHEYVMGSSRWLAPETISKDPKWSEKSDVFSLGILLWEIATGAIPFSEVREEHAVIVLVRYEGARPSIPAECPDAFAEVVRRCWAQNPEDRPSSKEVLRMIEGCMQTLSLPTSPQTLSTTSKQHKKFFEVNLDMLLFSVNKECITVSTTPPPFPPNAKDPLPPLPHEICTVRLSRPTPADDRHMLMSDSYHNQVFRRVEKYFERFYGDKATLKEVEVIFNSALEGRFRMAEEELSKKLEGVEGFYDAGQSEVQQQYLHHLHSSKNLVTHSPSNPISVWHAANPRFLDSIAWYGLLNLSSRDPGFYGKGIYLTQHPKYGEYYAESMKKEKGEFKLLLCWSLLGRPYAITKVQMGSKCQPGYNSHYVLVRKKAAAEGLCRTSADFEVLKGDVVKGKTKFFPIVKTEEAQGDEIVVFDSSHVLPKFIVHYTVNGCEEKAITPAPVRPQIILSNQFSVIEKNIPENVTTRKGIKNYLQDLAAGSEEWQVLKVIFLGNSQIGKTSLVQAVKGAALPSQKGNGESVVKATVGIECSTLQIDGKTVNFWDCAGQRVYTDTHQCFLSNEVVVYVICYDMSVSANKQRKQISSWLTHLNDLFFTTNTEPSYSTWRVIIVGTRADISAESGNVPNAIPWKRQFPTLPLHDQTFETSTITSKESAKELWSVLEKEGSIILNKNKKHIPTMYCNLLRSIRKLPQCIITQHEISKCHARWKDSALLQCVLQHLHAIGEIILFHDGSVCTQPPFFSQIIAKFISPEPVRNGLLLDAKKNTLMAKTSIETIFEVVGGNGSLLHELELISDFGICLKIPDPIGLTSLYLFPSIGSTADFKFTIAPKNSYQYAGIRITPGKRASFVQGLTCRFIVYLCKELNTCIQDVQTISNNGALLTCPGVMDGQLLVYTEDSETILCVLMATNSDLSRISAIFRGFISLRFPTYMDFNEETVCPVCVSMCFSESTLPANKISGHKHMVCRLGHMEVPLYRPKNNKLCWTHGRDRHDFFISYLGISEGKSSKSERVVWALYNHLVCQRKSNGKPVLAYFDQLCLNYGESWGEGFWNGMVHSEVIVLLISNKALENIRKNAKTKQDKILVEYECALIQHKLNKAQVVLVFVGEEIGTDGNGKVIFEPPNFKKSSSFFPDEPHMRNEEANKIVQKMSSSLPAHEKEFLGSISKTMLKILKLRGIHLTKRGTKRHEIEMVTSMLTQMLNEN